MLIEEKNELNDILLLIQQLEETDQETYGKRNEKKLVIGEEDEESDEFGLLEAEENSVNDMYDFLFEQQIPSQTQIREDNEISTTSEISSNSSNSNSSTPTLVDLNLNSSASLCSHETMNESQRELMDIDGVLEDNQKDETTCLEDDIHGHYHCSFEGHQSELEGEGDFDIEELFSTGKLPIITEFNEEKETQSMKQIENTLFVDWFPRLDAYFSKYAKKVLGDMEKEYSEGCKLLFERQMRSKPDDIFENNPEIYYQVLAAYGNIQTVYSGLCLSLIVSPCSEASCERVISRTKNIIGDQRYSFNMQTLEAILHI
ncbi:uncharacterized protein MONOS_15422 [Monocercomonoides exilis]|uniref:uncharacterized protein n=1 Tax=Monocercomonoides exilis TaxID=2049356 RepID=UPI0035594701|nr:hypothetical protein MONOS_15422 [Monocercomonoides exilis]|eukprot:MONOS_15422.1-p1 / transcript=MONOS_15422.1 / gene=MONOS_15422 / organism=Monocercomonoides_exilis_PA203 / gene_product=unspecified product / transcript_product=unspecified product / location=Mono_scaffold01228:3403-4350(+) / protein_length=316 / sequence_SO=supercontig / SO=protein_coding / is_pseudo=false